MFWSNWRKPKEKIPEVKYEFKFMMCYRLGKSIDKCTGAFSATVTATSEEQAKIKLYSLVNRRSRIIIRSTKICG